MNKQLDYDIVIAGGGLIGASLACALSNEYLTIAIIEPVIPASLDQPSYDDRGLALSGSTTNILRGLGLWNAVAKNATPIQQVHVSNKNHFGFVHLDAELMGLTALGYVVIARDLGQVLLNKISQSENIDLISPAKVNDLETTDDYVKVKINTDGKIKTVRSKLVIVADGTDSRTRELLGVATESRDYHQTAIVTNITTERSHRNIAYERFTETGPLALLPLSNQRCAVVLTVNSEDAEKYLVMDDKEFLKRLHNRFGNRLGKFQRTGQRKSYPIKCVLVSEPIMDRIAILGNAAHTIHPNGAQGFNLGLRDVAGLVEILLPAVRSGADPGKCSLLDQYLQLRIRDQEQVSCFTDTLANLFCNELPHKILIRNTGMMLTELLPPLKKAFTRRAMGLHGKQPALVRNTLQ